MKRQILSLLVISSVLGLLEGCTQNPTPTTNSKTTPPANPTPGAQSKTPAITFSSFPVPPKPNIDAAFIDKGKAIYLQNCAVCHGIKGDGKGDAAAFLLPKPRDFKAANFRLRTTPTGRLPTDADLFRAVSLGMTSTPMPAWRYLLSDSDRWAVVEYVKTFSPRFNDPKEDRTTIVELGAAPAATPAAIEEGKALFNKLACVSCHGERGTGDGPAAAALVDDSTGHIKPRDFSRPAGFKAGYSTAEIARTVLAGFNGTPMVGFYGTIQPQDAWKVAYYVQTLAKPGRSTLDKPSQNFLVREDLGAPDVRIKLVERAWKYDPAEIHVKKGQIVEVTFEPTDNGLGVGHGFAISSYDEAVFLNGAMVGAPKTVKFRAERAGKFTYYCATQCSTDKLHPTMNGFLYVEDTAAPQTASNK